MPKHRLVQRSGGLLCTDCREAPADVAHGGRCGKCYAFRGAEKRAKELFGPSARIIDTKHETPVSDFPPLGVRFGVYRLPHDSLAPGREAYLPTIVGWGATAELAIADGINKGNAHRRVRP